MGNTVKEIEDRFLSFLLDDIRTATGNNLVDPDGPDRERLIGFVRRLHSENIRLKGAIDFEKLRNNIDNLEKDKLSLQTELSLLKQGNGLFLIDVNNERAISCIELVRELTGFGLKESKDLVDKVRRRYSEIFISYKPLPATPQKIELLPSFADRKAEIVNRFLAIGCRVEFR